MDKNGVSFFLRPAVIRRFLFFFLDFVFGKKVRIYRYVCTRFLYKRVLAFAIVARCDRLRRARQKCASGNRCRGYVCVCVRVCQDLNPESCRDSSSTLVNRRDTVCIVLIIFILYTHAHTVTSSLTSLLLALDHAHRRSNS